MASLSENPSINDDPNQPLLGGTRPNTQPQCIQIYKRRWYIVVVFSLLGGTQGAVWNTFGPISATAKDAFNWTNGNIGFLSNWGCISFLIGIMPFIYLLERKGLRVACMVTAFFVAGGTLVRIFTMEPPAVTYLINVGQMLNGLGGPIAMAAPPAISAAWFPPKERTTATALGTFFGMFGTASAFIFGPYIVPDVHRNNTQEITSPTNYSMAMLDLDMTTTPVPDDVRIAKERENIHLLMYIECAWACMLFIIMMIYFPKKPPLPPSLSSAVQRENVLSGLLSLLRSLNFLLVAVSYGVSQGVLNCWASVISVILKPHGVDEVETGWIGFTATCGGCVASIILARLSDYMKRYIKWFVILFYAIAAACFLVFALAADGIIPPSKELFWAMVVAGSTLVYAATPLVFEMACETAYPVGEGTAMGILTALNNLFGLGFLFLLQDPHLGSMWMNWVLLGSAAICIPLLGIMKEQFNRLDLDENATDVSIVGSVSPPPQEIVS